MNTGIQRKSKMSQGISVLTLFIILVLMSLTSVRGTAIDDVTTAHSRGNYLIAREGTIPLIDGNITSEDHWDEAVPDTVPFKGGNLSVSAKHDGVYLYVLIHCVGSSYCPDDLFFEDDGIAPDRVLDGVNEDNKYAFGKCDAHWESGHWIIDKFINGKDEGAGYNVSGDDKVIEWWLKLNSGEVEDISVTSDEELGFGVGWEEGWPTDKVDPYDSQTWGTLQIKFPTTNVGPQVRIIDPSDNDVVHDYLDVEILAHDANRDPIDTVLVSVDQGVWEKAVGNTEGNWDYTVDTLHYPNGHVLDIRAKTTDGAIESNTAHATYKVFNVHPPTIIQPLPNQTFNEDEHIKDVLDLNDYFHDVDYGANLTYRVENASHVHLAVSSNGLVSLLADPDWSGRESIFINASDGELWVKCGMNITVVPVNDPPAVQIKNITVNETETVYVDLIITDKETPKENLTIKYHGDITKFPWTTDYNSSGVYHSSVEVRDDQGGVTSKSFTITVVNVNRGPSVKMKKETISYKTGKIYTFSTLNYSDPDGGTLSLTWDFGDGTNASGQMVYHKFSKAGEYRIRVLVADPSGATASDEMTIEVAKENKRTAGFDIVEALFIFILLGMLMSGGHKSTDIIKRTSDEAPRRMPRMTGRSKRTKMSGRRS